jgi:dTDP-glucose 4,6-dehydratase
MRLLITGGAGFIGSNFARYWSLRRPDDQLVVLDALTYAGNRDNLADLEAGGQVSFVHADIGDQPLVSRTLEKYEIDTIVNFAAESHNSLAVLDPARFFRTNVLGTQALCDAARLCDVNRFHHISTCEVYGDLDLETGEAFTEDSPYRPRTPYNASKASADHVVRCYVEFPEKVIPLFATRALSGEPLPLYASTQNRREWLHVDDHCAAIEAVLDRGRIGETYLVGSGREASIEEIADIVLEATGQPASLKTIVPDRPGHDRRYLLDSTKIHTELGWEPKIAFDDGIAATIGWYRDHEAWWKPLIGRSPVVEDAWSATAGSEDESEGDTNPGTND